MNRILFVCLLLITTQGGSALSKPNTDRVENGDTRVERAETRPDLTAQFDGVAQLKIASRKSSYKVGEMITLDIALLNTSDRPIFFRKLSELDIVLQNSAGQPLRVQDYIIADRAIVPSSFVRLMPNEIIVRSYQLLAGCDKRAFAQIASTPDDDLTVFKNGLFLNWGDACLPTTQPESYTVFVESKNKFVRFQSGIGKVRTAVGKITSNPLEIRIIN